MKRPMRVLAATATLLGLVTLSACEAGQGAGNAKESAATLGVDGEAGRIAVRNVYLQPADGEVIQQGGDAYLALTLVNSGQSTDSLTGVDVTGAGSVRIATSADVFSTPSATASAATPSTGTTGTATPSGTTSPSGNAKPGGLASPGTASTPSGIASTSPTPSSSASGQVVTSVPLPPGRVVTFTPPSVAGSAAAIGVSGLSRALSIGQSVEVTFHFRDAGDVTLRVPVEIQTGTTATATPLSSESPSPGPSLLFPGTPSPIPSPSRTPAHVDISSSPHPGTTVAPLPSSSR